MLITFFYCQGVFHKEFVPQGTIVTSIFNKGVSEQPLKRIAHICPKKFKDRDFFILLNNAPAHSY